MMKAFQAGPAGPIGIYDKMGSAMKFTGQSQSE
jgi:hypothetical protein